MDEKLELWKSLRDRGLITVKNIMDVVPGDYVLAMRNLDYPKPFNWDKWGAKGYYEQEFRKVVSIENEPQRGKLRPILDDGWVSHSSNPAKADVLVLTPDAFESEDTTPESETSDKISREDGFRLFEAIKKVYDFIHKMDRTEDPDAAKKDANDKVNQLAKILNPEDVDDFIRYVDAINKYAAPIMFNKDYLKNFSDYLDKYTPGQGVAKNPIHRSMDGREIKDGDILNVIDKYGDVRQIRFGIIRKRSNRPLTDKADTYELGYAIEVEENGSAWIVNINNSREVYEVSRSSHAGPIAVPTTPAQPEVVEEAKPAAETEYNKDLENDLAVFRNALEDIVENFRNQPGADKDVYKAATKEIYNELKKLNSLYNNSENSGEDLEKIREVYDQKMRDIGDIQAAKAKDLGPSPKEEVFAQSAADLQNAIIQEAIQLGDIEDKYGSNLRDTLFRVVNSYSMGEALKKATAKRIFRYMSDVKFDDLLKVITTNVAPNDLFNAGQTLDISYSRMLSPTEWFFDAKPIQKDPVWIYNAFNADLSNLKDGTELLVNPINNAMVDGLSIFTIDTNLINAVKNSKGTGYGPADSIDSKDILDYMRDKFELRVFSSYNQDDVDYLKTGMIGYLVKSWAISSNDNNLKMHAMQNLASEIFAMDNKATAGWNFINNKNESYVSNMRNDGRIPEGINTLDDLQDYMDQRIVAEANEHREVYTQFIHAMYNSTQDALKEAGIDGMILYRGTDGAEMKDNDKLPLIFSLFGLGYQDLTRPEFKDFINELQEGYVYHRPMSAWSTNFEIANTFSGRYGSDVPLIAGVKIPAERIFAFPGSGFGCYNEAEVVVLGGELTPVTYIVSKTLSLSKKNEFLETVKTKFGPKTILTMEKENGDFVEFLDDGPSPKEERPILNIDNSNDNADWIKQVSWDLPTDMSEFLNMFSTREQLSYFMTQPVAVGMPEEMSRSLWPAADEHFKKIDELPKPEEPKYLTEPFDPQDPNLDLEAFYNFDYSKNPDGSPFTRSQAGEMGYAELAVIREIHNGNEEDIKNAKRHRLDTYLKVTAKPDPKSTTTVESVDDQIEGDFDLDSPVEEYRSPYNPAIGLKRYVNYFTDKYGRRYVLLTDTSQNNTGNLYVTAYDTTGKTPEQVQEDFIDSKNYSTPDLHIAFLGAANAAPDYSDKNYESKRYVDLVTTSLEYRRRGLAAALLNVARKYSTEPILHSDTLSNAGFVFSNSVDRDPRDHINEKSIAWQEENSTSGPSPKEETPVSNFLPEPFDPRDKKIDLDDYYGYDYTKMPDGTPFNSDQKQQMDAVSRRIDQVLKANNGDTTAFAVKSLKNFRRTQYQQIIAKPTEGSSTTRDSILEQVEFSDKPSVKYFDEASRKQYTRYVDKFTDKYGRKYYIVTNIDERSGRQTVIAYDERNFEGMPLPEDYVRKDQPVSGITDVGGLDSYIYKDPSQSEIQSVMVNVAYQRRGIATALVAVLEKRLGLPVVHSDNLSSMGFAFSNSMDPGKPELHTNEESIQMQSETGPSPKEEKPSKKLRKEPFDPTDFTFDLEKFYNFDYSKMPDGRPFDVYRQQQMDILQDAIDNAPDSIERNLRINERRRIYQGYTAKPNLKSSTNLETIKNQVRLLDDNTSRMNYSGAGKPYADLSPEYKQSTQYIDEFTDKYGRQYWVVTKVVNGLGMSNVKLYDKSKNSLQDLQDNSEDILPVSMLDVFNNKISMVYTSDRYVRRGLATAALHLARERSGKEVQHSEMLTVFGRAFSISVDPNPVLHRNDESKALLLGNKTGPSPKQEIPEDDGGDEIDTNRTPGNILAAQLKVLADGLGKDFSENADYKDISVDPENLPESLDIWKNLQFMAPMSQDLKIVAAELISAEMRSSAKNILRSLSLLDSEELMDISDEVRSLLGENEDESDDYDIFMRAFETDINNLNIDSLILSYDAEDVLMYVSTMREFIDSDDEDRSDSYFTPERLLKQLNKYIKDVRDSEMQVLSSAGADIQESMRYVGSVLFIKQWAQSANDEILADVLQKAAVEAFNMKDGSWATSTSSLENEPDEKLKEVMRKTNANYKEKLDYLYDMNSQVYVDFIKGMYKVTQAYLKDLGIEYVRVYRGTGVTEAKDIQGDSDFKSSGVGMVDVLQRPMSSWSFDEETALGFAANVIDNDFRDPMFLATLVPAGQVLGFPGTGFGCFEEGELVLLGGFPRKVMAAVHKNNSQEKKSTGNWLTDSVVSTDPVSERDFFLRKALPQINEHFTNLSELDTQDLLNRNSGTSDSTGPSPKEERTNSDKNLVSLQQAYMEENDPELEVYEDSQTTFPRIGIGSDNRVIGYVKPRVLRSMKGNYTERTPNYRIDAKGGLYEPIRVSYDPENGLAVVVEGNHRVKAALDTKREYVPVFVVVERGIPTDSSEWEEGFSPKKLENVDKSKIPDDFKNLATAHPIYIFDKSDVLTPPEQTTPLNIDDTSKNSDWIKNTGPSPKEEKPVGGFPPEPFNPNDRTLDLDTIYNYDYTKLPDGTPFDAKQQKAMDHENKLLEDAIASGDDSKIRAAKIARRYTYSTFTTVANPDSKTNTETIADQITPGKAKPKKFTGFVRYTDNFIDKYGRKYVIFTDISTDDSTDNAVIVTAHDLESQFLTTLYTPEGMENVDRFGGKYLHIASLKVDDSDRKDLNGTSEIGIVGTDDAYRRRGLATALLYLARKHYKKPVNHSSTLTRFGRAFSNSVDAGKPDLHDSLESKQLQIDLLRKKGLPVEEPELDGDEIDYGPSPKEEKPLNVDNSIENSDWVISEFAKKKKLDAKENELPEGSNQANLAEELGISNDSKPSQNREGSKEQIIASAAKDIASSGIGFTPGTLKLKGNIATDGPDISISGSPKDRAKAPSDQATALKNEMISLGHTVLDDAIALSDEQAKAEGLIPEGYTAEEYRKKLENDVRAVEVGILRGDSKFRSMSQDLMRNAFNRLSYEDKEEIFQSLRQEALRGQGGALSGKDINVFSAEETFNMLLVEYGDDLAYKLSYDYATTYPEFLFDTGKTVLMRQRAEFTGRLTKKVEEEKTLVDVTWAHEGPDTILTMLTKWAIQSGKIDMSEFTKKAAEIKDFRDRLNSLPKAKDFTDKYHSIIGKNIKSQLENAGVEFDSVKVQDFFKQYKNYKLINTNDHFQDVRWDNNRKLIKNLEDTLSLIPKDIILAGMDYLKETGGMLGVQVSDARAHFVQHWLHGRQIVNMIRKNGQQSDGGYFRGDSTDDYLHEVWHFFQMINPDISTMEHAFTYDRVKEANSPDIFPIMELYETSVEKSFSGAKVVNPYTVKQYKRMTSKMSSFSPLNHSAEVITTTMQDLFTSPGRFSTPNGVTVKTGTGKKTTRFSDAHMDIATGIWYTDATMTTKIDPALITGIEGLDVSNDTDWDLKAFGIGLLLSLLNWENK